MYESLYPADDIWDKFDIPPVSLDSELLYADGVMEPPQVEPRRVMGGRHDCMWAGTCGNVQHQRQCCEPEPVVAVTVTVRPVKSSRSILRTTRIRARSASPRPETPSESEEDESPVCGGACDNEDLSVTVSVSEVTGQISRTNREIKSLSPPPSPIPSYYTDHSYHLSKTSVTLDNLGVQTPSDSAGKCRLGSDPWKSCPDPEEPEFSYPDSPVSCDFEEYEPPRTSSRRKTTPKFFDPTSFDASKRSRARKGRNKSEGIPRGRKPMTRAKNNPQTPIFYQIPSIREISDEEEEIDVVSVVDREKLTTLPTNPSARDRQQLQRTVATAIKQRASRSRKRPTLVSAEEEKRSHKRRRAREDGDDDPSEKRNQHNNMERLRRIDLRQAISVLRKLVPSVAKNERAAKVLILKEAASHCHQLLGVRRRLMRTREDLRLRQQELTARVKELRVVNAKIRGNVEKSPRKKRMGSR